MASENSSLDDFRRTDGASPIRVSVLAGRSKSKNTFSPLGSIEARLADEVLGLRAAWIDSIGGCWPGICSIGEAAGDEFEQRVAALLRKGFFSFGQLLCGLEVLLLKRQQLGVVTEQTFLGVEELCVHLANLSRHSVEVAQTQCSLTNFLGNGDRGNCAADERKVHSNSLVCGLCDCREHDSTARADLPPKLGDIR